jgi:hypothetical protein
MDGLAPVNPYEDRGYWRELRKEQEADMACSECGGMPEGEIGWATHRPGCACSDPRPRATVFWLSPQSGRPGRELTFGTTEQVAASWDARRGTLVEVRDGWHHES